MIDGKRDVAGGRRTTDLVTAASSARSKHFSSVCYTADGTCVLAGGNSRYVCLYQAAQRLLVKKFQVSHNRSLEGIVDKLHSGDMTEAGPRQGIDADSDSEDERYGDGPRSASRARRLTGAPVSGGVPACQAPLAAT